MDPLTALLLCCFAGVVSLLDLLRTCQEPALSCAFEKDLDVRMLGFGATLIMSMKGTKERAIDPI